MITLTLEEEELILERRRQAKVVKKPQEILSIGFLKFPMYRVKDNSRFEWECNFELYEEKDLKEFIENCKNRFYVAVEKNSLFIKTLNYEFEEFWCVANSEEDSEFYNNWAKENLEILSEKNFEKISKFLTEEEMTKIKTYDDFCSFSAEKGIVFEY